MARAPRRSRNRARPARSSPVDHGGLNEAGPQTTGDCKMAKSKNSEANRSYATAAEALANKPTDGRERRLYSVSAPDGRVVFVWQSGVGSALIAGARALGLTTSLHAGPPSREKVAGLIGQLSPEDRAAL